MLFFILKASIFPELILHAKESWIYEHMMFVPLPLQKLVLFFMLTPTLHYSLHPTLTLAEKSPYEERIESCFWREINATIFDLSGAGVLLIWIIFFQKKYCALTRGLNTLPIGVQRELNVQNGSRNSKILTFIFPICWLFILCRISIICTVQYTILFLCISFTEYPSNIFFCTIFEAGQSSTPYTSGSKSQKLEPILHECFRRNHYNLEHPPVCPTCITSPLEVCNAYLKLNSNVLHCIQ